MDCHITLLSDTHPWRPCPTLIHNWQLYVENATIKYFWDEVHCLGNLEVINSPITRMNKPEGHQVPHACHRCQAIACLFGWKFCKRDQQLRLSSGCMPSGDIVNTISQENREVSLSEQLITRWKWPAIENITKYKIDHLHLLKRKEPNAPWMNIARSWLALNTDLLYQEKSLGMLALAFFRWSNSKSKSSSRSIPLHMHQVTNSILKWMMTKSRNESNYGWSEAWITLTTSVSHRFFFLNINWSWWYIKLLHMSIPFQFGKHSLHTCKILLTVMTTILSDVHSIKDLLDHIVLQRLLINAANWDSWT